MHLLKNRFSIYAFFGLNKTSRFVINVGIIIVIWQLIKRFFIFGRYSDDWVRFNEKVADNLIQSTAYLLDFFGYEYFIGSEFAARHVGIIDSPGLVVALGCVAVPFMWLLTGLILAFPGQIKSKFLFIVFGILGIHLLNITRIFSIALYVFHINPLLKNHKVYFNTATYIFIVLMWIGFVNFSVKHEGSKQ